MNKPSLTLAALLLAAAPSAGAQQHPQDLLIRAFAPDATTADSENSRDILIKDLDRDGDLDIYVANLDQPNALFLNDGSGAFTRMFGDPSVTDANNSRGVAVGDVDRDGDYDLFEANSGGQANVLYDNESTGFVKRVTGPVVSDIANSRQAEFGDVDGDGDQDLFVTNFNFQDNFLYINQGATQAGTEGRFERQLTGDAVNDGGASYGLSFGDTDGDGDLDLFVANHSGVVGGTGAPNFLYTNDGAGEFTKVLTGAQSTDFKNSLAADFVDLEGDGDLDIFVGNSIDQANQLFVNNGSGLFSERTSSVLVTDRGKTIGSAWSDIDDDGDMDVIVANRTPALSTELFINIGGGDFARQRFGPLADNASDTYDVAVGDLDGDGRKDVALANMGLKNQTLRNHGTQWEDLGRALAGEFDAPTLSSAGNFLPNERQYWYTHKVPDDSMIYMLVGLEVEFHPFMSGTLVMNPVGGVRRVLPAKNTGTTNMVEINVILPSSGIPSDLQLVFQSWIEDSAAPQGFSATNGLRVTTP